MKFNEWFDFWVNGGPGRPVESVPYKCPACEKEATETKPCKCGLFVRMYGSHKVPVKYQLARAVTLETFYRLRALEDSKNPDAHLGAVSA